LVSAEEELPRELLLRLCRELAPSLASLSSRMGEFVRDRLEALNLELLEELREEYPFQLPEPVSGLSMTLSG